MWLEREEQVLQESHSSWPPFANQSFGIQQNFLKSLLLTPKVANSMNQGFGSPSPIKISIDSSKGHAITSQEKPRIVSFGVDTSKEAFAAFSWAVANLIRPSDFILLIHAYQTDYVFGSQYSKLANDTCRDIAKGIVQRYEDRCKRHNLKFRSVVACGNPAKVIGEAAVSHDSSLCVLGSKRRSYAMRVVLGSVVSAVLQHARCPVMIIKKPKVLLSLS